MRMPLAFLNQVQFEEEVARVARNLAPDVVEVIPSLREDWTGEPAAFFMVILSDSAAQRDRLPGLTNRVTRTIDEQLEPMERWGVFSYFNFRSQSEQARFAQPALA